VRLINTSWGSKVGVLGVVGCFVHNLGLTIAYNDHVVLGEVAALERMAGLGKGGCESAEEGGKDRNEHHERVKMSDWSKAGKRCGKRGGRKMNECVVLVRWRRMVSLC